MNHMIHKVRTQTAWGRFISPRENDIGRLRECSSIKRACSPRGKFSLVNDKIVGKVYSLRKKAGERHVSLARLIFPRGRPSSPREEVVEKEKPIRCIIAPVVSLTYRWHVVQHKNNSPKAVQDLEKENAEA